MNDSDTWIKTRLLKSLEGQTPDENFLGLFQYQLQNLYQLYFYMKELNMSQSESRNKIAQMDSQLAKCTHDM